MGCVTDLRNLVQNRSLLCQTCHQRQKITGRYQEAHFCLSRKLGREILVRFGMVSVRYSKAYSLHVRVACIIQTVVSECIESFSYYCIKINLSGITTVFFNYIDIVKDKTINNLN